MNDDIDDLRRAMDAATPAPDPARKAANLRLAEEDFTRLQESGALRRPTSERTWAVRLMEGAKRMLNVMTTKGGLAATTALVAVAMVYVAQDRGVFTPPAPEVVVADDMAEPASPVAAKTETPAPGQELRAREEFDATATDEAAGAALSELEAPSASSSAAIVSESARLQAAPPPGAAMLGQQTRLADQAILPEADTEAYANADENPLRITAEEPVSTFSIDVDTASYAVVRSSLNRGQLPPPEAVRVEEMINYFPYDYPEPAGDAAFRPTVTVTGTPWNPGTELVHIGIQGRKVGDRPPLNLVFLIDTSGSMNDPAKLPLLKQSFRMMLSELRPEDEVAIVTYAGSAGLVLEATPAGERETILAALDRLEAGGSTAGQEGLKLAYSTARGMAEDGEIGRVILATDGDFNVGISDPEALKDYIAQEREDGTYLSVLGFGRGNLDDATMQALAQNGNGQAAYIDTLGEARKVLVDQLAGALYPIADDVKIQVEFNPAVVAEYRLIGYETRALRREDFNNDRVDAGDIGAGHTVTAIYEIARVGSDGVRNDPLRYQTVAPATGDGDEIGFLKLRYKAPGASESVLIETPIPAATQPATDDVAFSTAIAGFGQLLRGSDSLGDWSYGDAISLASRARGDDPFGYRQEAVTLMRLAEALSR